MSNNCCLLALDTRVISIGCTSLDAANLHLANGTIVRIRLPRPSDALGSHSSALVAASLAAACTLNADIGGCGGTSKEETAAAAAHLRARWFSTRNAPGPTSISPNKEWKLFTQVSITIDAIYLEHFVDGLTLS